MSPDNAQGWATLNTFYKILIGFFVDVAAALFVIHAITTRAETKLMAAEQATAVFLAQAGALQGQKVDALHEAAFQKSRADSLEFELTDTRAKLAAMGPQHPVTNPASIPTTTKELAQAFTTEGFQPQVTADVLGWATADARPMLSLLIDGKHYPEALKRVDLMGQEVGTLTAQKDALTQSNTALAKAETTCEGQLAFTQKAVDSQKEATVAVKTELKAEKKKKWFWGVIGVGAGYLLKVVLVAF